MMANDSRFVLARLVRSGIWSSFNNLSKYKRLVLDAESAVTYLFKYCLTSHLERHKALLARGRRDSHQRRPQVDYYAATIVNFTQFGQCVNQMLDFFETNSIELHIVYRGKYMEAPIFGLLPAQVKKNSQRVSESLDMLAECANYLNRDSAPPISTSSSSSSSKSSTASTKSTAKRHSIELYMSQARPSRSNLALNIFKQIVNGRRRAAAQRTAGVRLYQAYYSSYPLLAKLARDCQCPVLTNDGDFIIMDVRAGFILFEDFFTTYLMSQNVLMRPRSASSVSSTASTSSQSAPRTRSASSSKQRRVPPVSPKSPAAGLKSAKSLFDQPSQASRIRFHYNANFLRQHPGLNQSLVLQLFPLTTGEFIIVHAKSMVKMRIYGREFKERDLIAVVRDLDTPSAVQKYHLAAARLEMVSRYLCTKDPELLNSLIKGEAHRLLASGSTFDEDYKELFNYYAVCYHFKNRLKFVLKYLTSMDQLAHIELCLEQRECSADYLLSLLCCSLGLMSSITYNKSMQFEDLQTRHSAHSMLDMGKQALMSMFSENKTHKSEHSASLSERQRELISSRFKMASLTVIDRLHHQLVERTLTTTSKHKSAATGLTLASLAEHSNKSAREAASLMELAFDHQPVGSFAKLAPGKIVQHVQLSGQLGPEDQRQLAILLNLHRFSLVQAVRDDPYFKANYLGLSQHFELALADQFVYLSLQANHAAANKQMKQLVDLVNRFDLENVAQLAFSSAVQSKAPSFNGKKSGLSKSHGHTLPATKTNKSGNSTKPMETATREANLEPTRTRIRHLIELLNSSLEAFYELNAFLNYPMPRLDLATIYNPILLYNFTLYNYHKANVREES